MTKEQITLIINTLASVKVEVSEAPKILGVLNILQEALREGGE